MIRIVIGGDVCPAGSVERAFIEGNAREIFHDLIQEIEGADLSIVNLECPLVSRKTPIVKMGPTLSADAACIRGFAAAKFDLLNLANNHILDHGAAGLRETIQAVKEAWLGVVGAGLNIGEAQTPFTTEIKGKRIVVYSMAEHEFNIADENTAGANPLDLIDFVKAIRLHKQNDTFIVLLHGGNEYYSYPSPEMVRRCRFMIDMGADAVVCCHTHCPLPWEIYGDRPIVYGLGNLVFESPREEPSGWYEGYLAALTFESARVRLEVVPYCQSHQKIGAYKMHGSTRDRFMSEMQSRSLRLADNASLEDLWARYCRGQRETYLADLVGYNGLRRKVNQLLPRVAYPRNRVLRMLHAVQCEAHHEVLKTLFKQERLA